MIEQNKKYKDKNIYRESGSKKNVFLWPQLSVSSLLQWAPVDLPTQEALQYF